MYQEWFKDKNTLPAVVVGAAFLLYFLYKRFQNAHKIPPGAVAVGTVKKLLIYPVKTLVAIPALEEARAVNEGLVTLDDDHIRDRSWMIVSDTGVFVSQRAEPKLALLRPSLPPSGDMLHIAAPECATVLKVRKQLSARTSKVVDVSVWGNHLSAVDCGDEAAEWMSAYLGRKGFRFVYLPPDMSGRFVKQSKTPSDIVFEKTDKTLFADAAPILLISDSSVKDIDERIKDVSITTRNFRPNIIVSGMAAYDEDTWDEIYIGHAKMTNKRLCDRCTLPTVDPDKGVKDPNGEPLTTLRTYRPNSRNDPFLGIYINIVQEGTMKVGDTVYVTRKSS